MKRPEWTVLVGVRPKPKGGAEEAKARAASVAAALVRYSRRERAAEAAGWDEVKDVPGAAAQGIGFKVRAAAAAGAAAAGETKAGAAEKGAVAPEGKKAPAGPNAPAPKPPASKPPAPKSPGLKAPAPKKP
jgi:hypothetical protein